MIKTRATPLTPRSERPFAALDAALLTMIQHHEGKPCPTRKEIREWTGMPRRRVWAYLEGMRERGLIEMEACGADDPKRRRMRKAGGQWTDWTARPGMPPGHPRQPRRWFRMPKVEQA